MSNATAEIPMANADAQGRRFHLPVNSGSQIYKGTLVAQLTATGKLVPFSTAASGPAIGKATHDVLGDGTNRCLIESECKYRIANGAGANAFSEATTYGVPVYGSDDHTASLTSVGDTLKRIGWFQGMEPSGDGRVLVHVSTFDYSAATADVGEIPPLNIVAVRGKTTANVADLAAFTVAGVDGLTYVAGERVLLGNDQTTASQRGPYTVGTVSGGTAPLTRVLDANGSPEISSGMIVHVSEGTVNQDRFFFLATNAPITVDTTSLSFTQLPSYADLASTATGLGASLVGIFDTAAKITATTVEGALAEIAAILFPLTRVQFVTGTLVGGTCTVTVGANQAVTALTKAFPIPAAVITGSTNFGSLAHLIASNVVGGSGVGQVVIRALGNDGAQDVDAAGTFHAFLVD